MEVLKRVKIFLSLTCFLTLFLSFVTQASPCEKEDFVHFVSTKKGCIGLQYFGEIDKNRSTLVVFLHGDSRRGIVPGRNHRNLAKNIVNGKINFVFMARPGYKTRSGNTSDGGNPRGTDGGDNYVYSRNIEPVGHALTNLKNYYQPKKLVVIGHSGGAATTGVLIGKFPNIIDEAVLIACPCYVDMWRRMKGRKPWPRSTSPHKHINQIDDKVTISIISGENDKNTSPILSDRYFQEIQKKGLKSKLYLIGGKNHRTIIENQEVYSIIKSVINRI